MMTLPCQALDPRGDDPRSALAYMYKAPPSRDEEGTQSERERPAPARRVMTLEDYSRSVGYAPRQCDQQPPTYRLGDSGSAPPPPYRYQDLNLKPDLSFSDASTTVSLKVCVRPLIASAFSGGVSWAHVFPVIASSSAFQAEVGSSSSDYTISDFSIAAKGLSSLSSRTADVHVGTPLGAPPPSRLSQLVGLASLARETGIESLPKAVQVQAPAPVTSSSAPPAEGGPWGLAHEPSHASVGLMSRALL
jgi:hypothetical protein